MKTNLTLMAIAGAVVAAGVANARAQYSSDNYSRPPAPAYSYEPLVVSGPLYVGLDLGGDIMQDMHVKPSANNNNMGDKMRFDGGSRFDVNFGCYVAPPLSFEFETGAIWNNIRHDANQPLTQNGNDASLYQVPLLVNMVFHIPIDGVAQLYFGAGGGGVISDLTVYSGRHNRDTTDDSDVVLAYQGMAGIKVPVWRNMEVDLGYKFLGTMSHTWFDGDNGPNGLFTHAGPAYSHSILASFTYNF